MFEHPLPISFKPLKLARQEGLLSGYMPLSQLTSLSVDSVLTDGRVEAELHLRMDGQRPEIHGRARAEIALTCQRCLEPVHVELDVPIELGFVRSEQQANELPSNLEPFIWTEEEVVLSELLEQELILALPIVAYHDHCSPIHYEAGEDKQESSSEKPNPFAVLQELKGDK